MSNCETVMPPRRQDVAVSFKLSHNLIVQGLVTAMVAIAGLDDIAWPMVTAWALTALLVNFIEDKVLILSALNAGFARAAPWLAPVLRVASTSLYALAALALASRGGAPERLFAFALMACSMVYVLMRYYRSPWIFLASISPYVGILGIIGIGLAAKSVEHRQYINAATSTFTLAIFGVLLWTARAQLATNWVELLKAREEAEERERAAADANRAKSAFLTTMSHELRTPLNGVLGMTQALTAEGLTPSQRERVKVIHRSGENLLAVLNDLLDLSKIEACTLELEEVEFDLEHMIRGVAAAFKPEAQKKGLTFSFEVTSAAAGRYLGDNARIKRILYNLCANAVKFTDHGEVRLLVDEYDGQLVMRVSDTGVGIGGDDQARLFDNFFQADGSLTRRHGGSGLGLAICRDLVRLMKGSLTIASELGHGSTFTVTLPLARIAAPESVSQPASGRDRPVELRVLAAEDNEINRLVLKTLLAQADIAPFFAINGAEAVAAWERQDWDVILMDIQMPEMDGVTATRTIRRYEQERGVARTPIIAVTANAMAHQVAEYEAAGMDAVMPKPVDITRLFNLIEQVLDHRSTDAAAPARGANAA